VGRYTELTWYGGEILVEMEEHAGDGVDDAMEMLLAASRAVVPVDSEDLYKSGKASRDKLTGLVSYNTVYAVRQHEELDWHHDPGQQAKYLEQPFNELQAEMIQAIADRLRTWMAR
jgi:hypothetical protein